MKEGKRFVRWPCEFNQLGLSHPEKILLLTILSFSNREGKAWPSLKRLAEASGLGLSTVKNAIASLEALGVLERSRSDFRTNAYKLADQDKLARIEPRQRPPKDQLPSHEVTTQAASKQTPLAIVKPHPSHDMAIPRPSVGHVVTSLEIEQDPKNKIHEQEKERTPGIPLSENRQADFPDFASANREPESTPELDDWGYPIEPTSPDPQPTVIALKTPETGQGLTIAPSDESLVVPEKKIKPRARKPPNTEDHQTTPGGEVWNEYATQFERKYGVPPVRPSGKERSNCKQLVDALGKDQAIHLVAYYVQTNHRYYVEKCHPIGLAVSDRHRLMTELATGKRSFRFDAEQAEKAQRLEQLGNIDWDEIESPFATEEENNARLERLAAKKNATRSNLLR